MPGAYGQVSTDQNFILTKTYKKKTTVEANDNLSVAITVQYLDGLGRPIQNQAVQASPNGKDVIGHIEYLNPEAADRSVKSYLPFTESSTNRGKLKESAGAAQASYYGAPPADVTPDGSPFGISKIDNSPLGRQLESQAVGAVWNDKRGKLLYTFNKVNENDSEPRNRERAVKKFSYNGNYTATETNLTAIVYGGNYADNSLSVIKSTDEDLNQVNEYKDSDGKTVLKRQFVESDTWNDTYYVYDDLGQLRAIIPPLLSRETFATNSTIPQNRLNDLAYLSSYDENGNVIVQKNPGVGANYIVFDYWGRKAFTQDGNQRARNGWSFVKYDMLNRTVVTGEITSSKTRSELQSATNSLTGDDKRYVTRQGNEYSIGNNPTDVSITMDNVLSVFYFDTYDFEKPSNETPAGYAQSTLGLSTGSRSRVLGTSDKWIRNVIYYDSEFRTLQSVRDLYDIPGSPSPTEAVTVEYDAGYLSKINRETIKHAGLTNSTTNTFETKYCYDHALRLKKTTLKVNALPEVTLNYLTYNELGQLAKKSVGKKAGGNFADEVFFQYHIQGAANRITSTNFRQEVYFERKKDNSAGYLSGGITEMYWQNGGGAMKGYAYQYDRLNRLTSATSSTFQYEEKGITYDANGNIKTLQRTWGGTSPVDNLTYTYASSGLNNQLATVSDAGNGTGYKNGSSTYAYDANGNVVQDGSRNLTGNIVYNLLDRVESLTVNGKNIRYTYSANGEKLKYEVVGTTAKTVYAGSAEYDNVGNLARFAMDEGFVTYNSATSSFSFFYYLTDYLGNTRAVLDENGNAVQTNEYLAFGSVVSSDGSPYTGKNKYFYQGKEIQGEQQWYDFHARMYDPLLARFNGIDPKSQFASPYMAMGNNPIMGVDPDGEWVQMAIGAAISAVSYTASVAFSKGGFKNWNWGQFGIQVAIGAVSGALASGIGDAAGQISNVYSRAAFQAVAHGHVGGVMSQIQGGSYGSGMLTGAAGSLMGSATAKLDPLAQLGASAAFGGVTAELSGGNFWKGAGQSAIVTMLNHMAHEAEAQGPADRSPNEQMWDMSDPRNNPLAPTQVSLALFEVASGAYRSMITSLAGGVRSMILRFSGKNVGRVFWSGNGNKAVEAAARKFAEANGMTTLEMTRAGENLTQLTKSMAWGPEKASMWQRLSAQFARGSHGTVHVFQNAGGVNAKSVWLNTELPILKQNGVKVIYHMIP